MIPILYEDNHLLALDKPAGVLSQGDATGDPSVVDIAREYIRTRYNKPGNVFVGLVHRLDRPVSGVILLAKTSKGAERMAAQFRDRGVEKTYMAVVEGRPEAPTGVWVDRLIKDESQNRVSVVTEGGVEAGLAYEIVEDWGGWTIILLRPTTGRGHQLRVQLASRGMPIVGDRKYGADSSLRASDGGFRIALHARDLVFNHPTRPERVEISSLPPRDWPAPARPATSPTGRGS